MREISVICPKCKELVPVVERTISEHNACEAGGMYYAPSPRGFKAGPGGPTVTVLASKAERKHCDGCQKEHTLISALVKVDRPNVSVN